MYLKKLMKNAALLLCSIAMISAGGEVHGMEISYGSATVRPDEACLNALKKNNPQSGSIGAGTGATVGKMCGMKQSQKSGIGYYAMQIGDLKIGAVVVVNAMGDVYAEGRKIAGLMNESRTEYIDSTRAFYKIAAPKDLPSRTNTTIGAIITNGRFDKA